MGYLYKPPPPVEDKYLVKWSFHAGKWWAGEQWQNGISAYRIENVKYYDTWREAMDDIALRMLLDKIADYAGYEGRG
jgi:hypothetical protein